MNTKIKMLIIVLISIILIFNLPMYSKAEYVLDDLTDSGASDALVDSDDSNEEDLEDSDTSDTSNTSGTLSIDSIFAGAKDFLSQGSGGTAGGINEGEIKKISDVVSGILLTIAIAVTFISIAVMGVNFAIQTVEEKAKIKEAMVPWVIGIFISFGAYGIWKIVMNIFYRMDI